MTDTRAPRYGQVDSDYAATLATTPPEHDGPVWMVNLMKYRERADYGDGDDRGLSGREADERYTPLGPLAAVGAEIVFVGDVESQLLGDAPRWDRVAVVKYPTRRAFIDMQLRDDFQEQHVHKDAGMEETIVMGCLPIPVPGAPPGVELPAWTEVPHPPTDDDGPISVLHVIRFNEAHDAQVTPEDMEAYQAAVAGLAIRHGVRISGWFASEGTIIGDGRQWDQVRFNGFPSKAAFMALVTEPGAEEARRTHRDTAIADTYTMILRPEIDWLRDSLRDEGAYVAEAERSA